MHICIYMAMHTCTKEGHLFTTGVLTILANAAIRMKMHATYRHAHPLLVAHDIPCSWCFCLNHCSLHLDKHCIIGMESGAIKPKFP